MKVAVTDACIFIDLIELDLLSSFFELQLEVNTSVDVFYELYPSQQGLLTEFKSEGKLFIHNILPEERDVIAGASYPRSLSESDKSVVFLAKKINALILSSDKALRNYSKRNSIPYHGMLWIFDRLIESNLVSGKVAVAKIKELISQNIVYQNNIELISGIERRISQWNKL